MQKPSITSRFYVYGYRATMQRIQRRTSDNATISRTFFFIFIFFSFFFLNFNLPPTLSQPMSWATCWSKAKPVGFVIYEAFR